MGKRILAFSIISVFISILIITSMIYICNNKNDEVIVYHLDWVEEDDGNYLNSVNIHDSVLLEKTNLYWNLSIIDGRGTHSYYDPEYHTDVLNLSRTYLNLSLDFVNYILHYSLNINETTNKNDHLSFTWRQAHINFFVVGELSIWNNDGLKYHFSPYLDPIHLMKDKTIYIEKEDILVDTLEHNESTIIEHPYRIIEPSEKYPYERSVLWSPLNDTIFFMNKTDAANLGFYIIQIESDQLGHPIGEEKGAYYYDPTLVFTIDGMRISLREGESYNMKIGNFDYHIEITSLYLFTTLTKYMYSIEAPWSGQSFFIERV